MMCRRSRVGGVSMRLLPLAVALAGLATTHGLQAAYEEPDEYEDAILEEEEERGLPPQFAGFARKVQRSVDSAGLLRARRWGNIANGILLGATGPVTLAVSAVGLKLSGVVLSAYITAVGGLLAGIELGVAPVAPWAAENLRFFTTQAGKTVLLFFAGNIAWAFGKAGLVPALLTCANAAFNWKFRNLLEFVSADEQPGFAEQNAGFAEPAAEAAYAQYSAEAYTASAAGGAGYAAEEDGYAPSDAYVGADGVAEPPLEEQSVHLQHPAEGADDTE